MSETFGELNLVTSFLENFEFVRPEWGTDLCSGALGACYIELWTSKGGQ